MADTTEESTFQVNDRRGGAAKRDEPAAPIEKPRSAHTGRETAPSPPPLDFPSFLISLASNAAFFLGEPGPDGRTGQMDLVRAQEMIDLLALLEDKTRGNLSSDESSLLTNLLYTLRLRYVEKAR